MPMFRKAAWVLWVFACPCPGDSPDPPQPKPDVPSSVGARIDAAIEAARSAQKIPGVTLLVEHHGQRLVGRGYGLADVDQGRLRLDDDVTGLIRGLRVRGGTVTLHHLLSHTHGIAEYNRDETRDQWPTVASHDRILSLITDRDLALDDDIARIVLGLPPRP
jgi:CubicO group peptidase (beta-lactamase class C family)